MPNRKCRRLATFTRGCPCHWFTSVVDRYIEEIEAEEYLMCDELANKGTGLGICNTKLDEHGVCPNASKHLE